MTGKRASDIPSTEDGARKLGTTQADQVASENALHDAPAPDAAVTPHAAVTRASVHEAIGKLIGDDAERQRGTADKEASGVTAGRPRKPRNR